MQAELPQFWHGLYPIYSYLCFLCNAFIFVYFECYRSLSYELLKLCTIPSKFSKIIQFNTPIMWIILFPWYIISWWISLIELTWVHSEKYGQNYHSSLVRVRGGGGPTEQPRAGGCGRTGRARSRTIVLSFIYQNTFIKQFFNVLIPSIFFSVFLQISC